MSIPYKSTTLGELFLPTEFLQQLLLLPEPITLVVNDATRPSPVSYLSVLQPFLPKSTRVLFATGTHREVSARERKHILGENFVDRFRVASNNCEDGSHVYIGTTSRGTEVEIHPWVLEGSVVAVNTVEPHYFAGYTGGRKSIVPGIASRKTIIQNHYWACFPEASVGKLLGNPVHEDLVESVEFLNKRTELVMLNGVTGSNKVFCGGYNESFIKAVSIARSVAERPLTKLYSSLEVRPGRILEVSLYQAMKAVYLWESAVEDGGELVLNATCPEGLGAKQMEKLLINSMGIVAIPKSSSEYNLGDHSAIRISRIRKRIRLSFNTGTEINFSRYGFSSSNCKCEALIDNAGFCFPTMKGLNA